MTTFRQQYKGKTFGFGSTEEGRLIRVEKHEESRKRHRAKTFNENRNISNSVANTPQNRDMRVQAIPLAEDRMTRLLKWKAERERRKKVEQTKKKPPFVVGVVHHKVYSPANKEEAVASTATREKVCSGHITVAPVPVAKRVTKATEKRLINKALAKKPTKIPLKTPNPIKREQKSPKKQDQSFAPANHKFKAPAGLNHVPLFGRVVMQSMSPGRISEIMSSSRMSRGNRKSGIPKFIVEDINCKKEDIHDKKEDTNDKEVEDNIEKDNIKHKEKEINNEENYDYAALTEKDGNADDVEDGSIEAVSLKLSFDEKDTNDISSTNNNNKDETFTFDTSNNKDDTFNVSTEKMNSSKTIVNKSKVHNGSITEALSSSKNDTSISAHLVSPHEPVFFSPYVVASRGKSNARKEEKIKRGFSLGHSSTDDIPTKETVMKNLNISIEEEERTAQYFQFLLNREIERLNDLCTKWTKIKDNPDTTEDGQYEINQAIGQTNLLINKKFERFRGLVTDCETGKGEMLVTCKDLQGFWDMMYMEVKNCDLRFEKLEKLRLQGWVEEEVPVKRPVNKKKTTVKKKVVPAKSSSIRAFLAEKKKKMAQEIKNSNVEETDIELVSNNKYENCKSPNVKHRTRRSMSVGPNENKFTPMKAEKRLSLLQKVQMSETSKKIKSPLTIIKVSQMCKTPEIQLDDTISYVNSDQTPGKSILKQPKNSNNVEARVKTTNKVNFDDHIVLNEVPVDEETQTRLDLAAALSRIDSLDFDSPDEMPIKAERKLAFDSSDESEEDGRNSSNKSLNKVQATSRQKSGSKSPCTPSPRCFRRQDAVDESGAILQESPPFNVTSTPFKEIVEDKDLNTFKQKSQKHVSISEPGETNEHSESIKILRNRKITAIDTPKSRRRSSRKLSSSVQESEQKENKTPSDRRRRKSSLKVSINTDEKAELHDYVGNLHLEETNDRRRSSRNVKFADKECSGCILSKPALPMTPHVRRSRAHSIEKKKKSITSEDLISWDTPEKPPERIRRSQGKKV